MLCAMSAHASKTAGARTPDTQLAVTFEGAAREAAAEALATELGLPLLAGESDNTHFLLVVTDDGLVLRDLRDPRLGPICADFAGMDTRPYSPNLSRRQPLARAFGKKIHTIVDATAGLAQDALRLALMGFHVTATERSPVVAALARDGLRRFESERGIALGTRLSIRVGDARTLLSTLPRPDAVYLDPMFPAKRKHSAAARKEMRVLRDLVGEDRDAVELLAIARTVARERVVVKRADDAPPLAPGPHHSILGKLIRYDVYLATGA